MAETLVLRGLEQAPEFFIEDIHSIEFLGVTTLFTPYRLVSTPEGKFRFTPFTVRVPTGALATIERRLFEFVREHRLAVRQVQDATR